MQVQCFPFYSIMLALGNPVVDYFSLDVEGAEIPILKTIPFDKVTIKTMTIEFNGEESVANEMKSIMTKNGYKMVKVLGGQDLVFVKE